MPGFRCEQIKNFLHAKILKKKELRTTMELNRINDFTIRFSGSLNIFRKNVLGWLVQDLFYLTMRR